jgi:DNA-binding response OmpR family regulator
MNESTSIGSYTGDSSAEPPLIALVEDDPDAREEMADFLRDHEFGVVECRSVADFRAAAQAHRFNLCLFDIGLGQGHGSDGLDLAREVRAHSGAGVVIVTGRTDRMDKILGLETGADDYVSKPVDLHELHARVRSVLRRCRGHTYPEPNTADEGASDELVYRFKGWMLYTTQQRLVSADGREIHLTGAEFRLLERLAGDPTRPHSRNELALLISNARNTRSRTVDTRISLLRTKLREIAERPIVAMRGVGYKLAWPVSVIRASDTEPPAEPGRQGTAAGEAHQDPGRP